MNKGHNSGAIAVEQLKTIIARIEKLEEEKANLAADIREVYAEAKGNGFYTKVMREIIKLRKADTQTRRLHEEVLGTYKAALGMDE